MKAAAMIVLCCVLIIVCFMAGCAAEDGAETQAAVSSEDKINEKGDVKMKITSDAFNEGDIL